MDQELIDWSRLSGTMAGSVAVAGDAGFDDAARWPVRTTDQRRPAAIASCDGPTDVARVLSRAEELGLPVGVRGGGHGFAGHSRTDGLLIDTRPMQQVRLDGDTATVGAGAFLGEVYDTLGYGGRTIPAGCGPTVGIAGLALGGGVGVIGRTYGFTCDALIGAEVVLADGTVVRCDADSDADLFWALRGAGSGSFGVVTSLTFATVAEPPATALYLTWPPEGATALIGAWQEWLSFAPDRMSLSLHLVKPAQTDMPVRLRMFGAAIGVDHERAADLREATRFIGEPTDVHQRDGSLREVKRHLAELGDQFEIEAGTSPTSRGLSSSVFVSSALPADVLEELVELTTNRTPGMAHDLDLMPLGGAYNCVAPDATAFVHRQDLYLLKYSAIIDSAGYDSAAKGWLAAVAAVLEPHATGRAYQNFADPSLSAPLEAYYGTNLPRLLDVKNRYDPSDVFHHQQSIPATARNEGNP